jgi:hypothetical protein
MTDDVLTAPVSLPRGEYANGLAGVSGPDLDPEQLEHLPEPLRAMVLAVAEVRAVPTSATVALALAALGGACGGIARVQPYPDRPAWHEAVSVSAAIIMASGTGKSDFGADFTRAHGDHHDAARTAASESMRRADARARAGRRRLQLLERDAAKTGPDAAAALAELEDTIAEVEQAEAEARGPAPVLGGTDLTTEGLVRDLAKWGRVFVFADEGNAVAGFLGLYNSGKSNTGALNSALDEARIAVTRSDHDRNLSIRRPSLTFGLMLQPAVLEQIRGDVMANGSGFTARLLYAVPPDPGASLPGHARPTLPDAVRAAWDARVMELCEARDGHFEPQGDREAAPRITFGPEAVAAFMPWESSVRTLEVSAPNVVMRSWRAKHPGRVASMAALLHLARHGRAGLALPVGADDVRAAIALGDAFAEHAEVAIGSRDRLDSDRDPVTMLADRALTWARERYEPRRPFTSSELRKRPEVLPRSQRCQGAAERVAAALRLLAAEGLAEVVERHERGHVVQVATLTDEALAE